MDTFIYIIVMLLIGVVCYFIGLRRGIISTRHLYDEGWLRAENYFKHLAELVQDNNKTPNDLSKEQKNEKAREFVAQLDELFNPKCPIPEEASPDPSKDNNIYDCGEY